ncbi:urea amidolyase associated protein UAAP2 [Paenibacillus crassostreae]|uniref:Urea carboxylase n=1 Tax=Paenibacillus crassostreae TaxID=1763538 RepID=A0A167DTQ1_9BACL|nr:urea amidolyase associated protein UAAP2 [Paenibacillus crassostreae]AOZ91075.1 urea carboxylase [Paenibacillus crassostreae]OAB74764.1 urea carboxylase [Paenibacillus crassostreae]
MITQAFLRVESERLTTEAVYSEIVKAGDGFMYELKKGQVIRILDLAGNQAADTLLFDADFPEDHYSAIHTISAQQNIYITTGTVLRAESGTALATVVADTCGRHDTVGGSCSSQSNTVRYAHKKAYMHNCRDTFMLQLSKYKSSYAFSKRDLAPNINFFMNVPVTPDGGLTFADGVSAPGCYIELKAEKNIVILISNCPQLNNPCNAYNPTPIEVLIWNS